jgi:hypothetical protein
LHREGANMHSPYVSIMACFQNSIERLEFQWKQSVCLNFLGCQTTNCPVFGIPKHYYLAISNKNIKILEFSKSKIGIPMERV